MISQYFSLISIIDLTKDSLNLRMSDMYHYRLKSLYMLTLLNIATYSKV